MKITHITKYAVSLATGASLLLSVVSLPVYAANLTNTDSSVKVSATDRLPTIITRSDTAITARLTDLNKLSTRLADAKNISASEKAALSATIQTNISGLTSLKAKIDADTDVATALTDEKTITASFRIYALVIPQGYIEASADRVGTIVGMFTDVSVKLQTRITAEQTAGKDVTSLQAALNDLTAKTADANTNASVAQSAVASLTPDQGNATVAASNKAALVAARGHIKTSTSDLHTARQDAKTIVDGLKSVHVKAGASATVSQ